MCEQHLKNNKSYAQQHYSIEECKDMNIERECSFVREKIKKNETCIPSQNLSVRF
jgi:hypothetical protein